MVRVASLENNLREKEQIIEKLTSEKKVLEKINRDQEKQLTELREEYKKSSNVRFVEWDSSLIVKLERSLHILKKSVI